MVAPPGRSFQEIAVTSKVVDTQELGQVLLGAGNDTPLHLAGTLGLDHWQGREEVQFRLLDATELPRR